MSALVTCSDCLSFKLFRDTIDPGGEFHASLIQNHTLCYFIL